MILDREAVYAACFAQFAGLSQFKYKSRRLEHWTDNTDRQPALYQQQHLETVQQKKGTGPIWRFSLTLWIYYNCKGDPQAIPSQQLNVLVDLIDRTMAPNAIGEQTLSGLVSRCWISGPIDIYEGYKGLMDQSVVIIPVEIEVPDASGAY